jgi:hypothetical protein
MPPIIPTLIRPTTLLHKPLLQIILLALLTPLWRLILPILLLLITLLLRLMHSPTIMLSGTIHSHKLQRLRLRSIDELVLSPSGHDDDVGGFDVLFAECQSST